MPDDPASQAGTDLVLLAPIVDSVRVEIPRRRFGVLMRLRRYFPCSYPDVAPWTWIIPGSSAWRRAERFASSIEGEFAAQARRDAWNSGQDEWEQAGRRLSHSDRTSGNFIIKHS